MDCSIAVPEGILKISGDTVGSDIKNNNFNGTIRLLVTNIRDPVAAVIIKPFTHNCGIKTIQELHIRGTEFGIFLEYVENICYSMTNAGILIGSDWSECGYTYHMIQKYGKNWEVTSPVWNPNYTWSSEHKICLLYKYLEAPETPLWTGKT